MSHGGPGEAVLGEGEQIDRFEREARAAAALDHPHIVKVLDVGELPPDGDCPRGPLGRSVRWSRRRPLTAGALVVTLAVAVALGIRYLGPARLRVTTDPPETRITVNGRPLGNARWIWPFGSLLIRIEADGYEPHERVVELLPACSIDLGHVRLAPDHGLLTVETDPPGATIRLDGREVGATPIQGVRVRNGLYALEARLPLHEPWRRVVEVRPGETSDLGRVDLLPERGFLTLTGSAAGETVSIREWGTGREVATEARMGRQSTAAISRNIRRWSVRASHPTAKQSSIASAVAASRLPSGNHGR